jgi:GNAT superfamily N-acetyltransferase
MMIRRLQRHEIETIWSIDRSEVHHHIYRFQGGELVLEAAYFDAPGWPLEQIEQDTTELYATFDRGGAFIGSFDGDTLAGVAVLDSLPIGPQGDHLQLKYLYVSRPYRQQGVGSLLFREAATIAHSWGARTLYISATPTRNTVDFYLHMGATLAPTPIPDLYAREPEDIHLIYPL